jgi:hypothetical protein
MDILLPHPPRPRLWRHRMFSLAILSLLGGCTNQGDFGQVTPIFVRDDMHDWLSVNNSYGRSGPASNFRLTDDERQLRDLAYPLIEAPYDRQQWYSAFNEYKETLSDPRAPSNRSDYANRLMSESYRSPSARYAQLTDDVRNDIARLPQFFETAARVTDIDQKRRQSLAYISDLSPGERDHALRRINENKSLIVTVRGKLAQRVIAYRFALERLVIMTPSQQAVEVERSLNQLQAQMTRYGTRGAPTWAREQSLAASR